MKRLSAVIAALAITATITLAGASSANAASATWNRPAVKKAVVEPMPNWGPGWCFVRSGGGWLGYGCK